MMTDFMLFLPELFFIFGALLFFIFSLRKTADPAGSHKWAFVLAGIGLLVTVVSSRQEGMLFFNCYRVDLFSQIFKVLLALGTVWVIFSSSELKGIDARQHAEYYFLDVRVHAGHDDAGQLGRAADDLRIDRAFLLLPLFARANAAQMPTNTLKPASSIS